MAREKEEIKGPESAKKSIWSIMKEIITNQRGEIGIGDGDEGGADAEKGGEGWDIDGKLPEGMEIETPAGEEGAEAPVVPIPKKPKKEEGQEPKPEGEEEAEEVEEEPGEEELPEIAKVKQEYEGRLADVEARLAMTDKALQFYMAQLNDKLNVPAAAPAPHKEAIGALVPGGEDEAPPEAWDSSQSVVEFFDRRSDRRISNTLQQAYKENVQPEFTRVNQAIHSLIERVVKPQSKDWDDVIKGVTNELFVLDQTGQNIVGYRNPALLNYFQAQPIPIIAMYDYGLSKRAPKTIADGIKKGTQKAISKITQKPKAPAEIRGKAKIDESDDLDWNAPKDKVEKVLAKKGLI